MKVFYDPDDDLFLRQPEEGGAWDVYFRERHGRVGHEDVVLKDREELVEVSALLKLVEDWAWESSEQCRNPSLLGFTDNGQYGKTLEHCGRQILTLLGRKTT